MAQDTKTNFTDLVTNLSVDGREYQFYDVLKTSERYLQLPYCLRFLFESSVRKSDLAEDEDVAQAWRDVAESLLLTERQANQQEILFQPGRVVLQDFTGVAALVDLAAMRDAVAKSGHDAKTIDAKCPADLVIDHCVQVDFSQIEATIQKEEVTKESNLCQTFRSLTTSIAPATPPPPGLIVHTSFPPPVAVCPYYLPAPAFYQPPPTFCTAAPPPPFPVPYLSSTVYSEPPHAPKVPRDNPGLPVQDDVCPFHQRLSFWSAMLHQNRTCEMERNKERFQFLKWVDLAFDNVTVIPPGTGVMHRVNLEYLARVVTCQSFSGKSFLFPDSLVGTDGHTTLVNGLGVLGWSVGTLEAESVMFGHPVTFRLPRVIGVEVTGSIPSLVTSTDVVLLITKNLRKQNFSGDVFVEFFGPSVRLLSVADRSAIANMCAEYGALIGYFPIDELTMDYLSHTGRDRHQLKCIEAYMKRVALMRTSGKADPACNYDEIVTINLCEVAPCVSGPKSCKEKIPLNLVPSQFRSSVGTCQGRKLLGIQGPEENSAAGTSFSIDVDGRIFNIGHGTILVASIASCSNSSNPSVMLSAGLLAKKAVEAGLSIAKFVRRSLCPGSGIVTSYLQESGVMPYLHMLGFEVMGYGCSACVDNSRKPALAAETDWPMMEAIRQRSLACVGIYAGNRNFEGRLDSDIKANYLVSPQLVIAYAIAGRIDIDFEREPIGWSPVNGAPIYLSDVWPTQKEVRVVEHQLVIPAIFRQVPTRLAYGTKEWSALKVHLGGDKNRFQWNNESTYIRSPDYIESMMNGLAQEDRFDGMRCLLKLEDDISSDFISPAGSIVRNSPAADYLSEKGLVARLFNSYGARRGNWEVMVRGTFAHPRLKNLLAKKLGPFTVHFPSGVPTTIFEASQRYSEEDVRCVVVAGDHFGRGAARDWATKGPYLLGVRAVMATSFNPSFRANLVKIGILPLKINRTFFEQISGDEKFDIKINRDELKPRSTIPILLRDENGKETCQSNAEAQLENAYEVKLFLDGGIICQMAQR